MTGPMLEQLEERIERPSRPGDTVVEQHFGDLGDGRIVDPRQV